MATLDSFREATGEPIQLDLANGYIADIRLNAGDVNGTKTCSRNFHGIVERAVFDATAPDAQDQMNVLEQLIDDANKAVKNAVSAAGEAKDAANAARTSVIEYRQLSDDCKAKIAASAAIGVVFATQADIDAQYDTVIAPALSDAETIPPLTQSDIDWALDIINR